MQLKSLIAVPLVVLALAGCSSQAQNLQPSETSAEQTPLFANDEEALVAAQAAYAHYLEVSDQIARDGGANPERLKGLVSSQLFVESKDVFQSYSARFIAVEGSTAFDTLHVADLSSNSASFYVCLDVSSTKLIGNDGSDVTPQNRQSRLPIVFEIKNIAGKNIIESSEVWSGRNYC